MFGSKEADRERERERHDKKRGHRKRERGDPHCPPTRAEIVSGTGLGRAAFFCYPVHKVVMSLKSYMSTIPLVAAGSK